MTKDLTLVRRAVSLLTALAIVLAWSIESGGQSGFQITPSANFVRLISKDVGPQRWAVIYAEPRPDAMGRITGNLFSSDGAAPQFLTCLENECGGSVVDGRCTAPTIDFRCWIADGCTESTCSNWSDIGPAPPLDRSFLGLDLSLKTEDLTADRRQQGPPMVPSAKQTGRAAGLIPAAVQRDPKTGQRLVSKDIGGQRWAITYDETGGSAIGNVYNQDGSPPQFVYCERNGDDGSRDVNDLVLYFDCRVASSCRSDTCSSRQWSAPTGAAVPYDFFLPARAELPAETQRTAAVTAVGISNAATFLQPLLGTGLAAASKGSGASAALARPAGVQVQPCENGEIRSTCIQRDGELVTTQTFDRCAVSTSEGSLEQSGVAVFRGPECVPLGFPPLDVELIAELLDFRTTIVRESLPVVQIVQNSSRRVTFLPPRGSDDVRVGRAITLDLNGSLEVSDGETIGVLEQNTAVDVVQEFTEPSELTEVFTGGARRLIDTNAGYDVTTSFSGLTVRTRTAGGEVRVAYEGSAALNCNVLTNLVTTPVELVFLAGQRCPVAGEIGVYAAGRLVAVVIYTGGGGGRLEFQTGEVQSFDDCGELTSSISACSSAQCGNGIVEFTEQCDGQALANACGLGQSCDETCTCRTFGSVFEAFLKQPDSLL